MSSCKGSTVQGLGLGLEFSSLSCRSLTKHRSLKVPSGLGFRVRGVPFKNAGEGPDCLRNLYEDLD